jgi:hypothetical protein
LKLKKIIVDLNEGKQKVTELEKLCIEEEKIPHEIVIMPCGQFYDKKDWQNQMIPIESQASEQKGH